MGERVGWTMDDYIAKLTDLCEWWSLDMTEVEGKKYYLGSMRKRGGALRITEDVLKEPLETLGRMLDMAEGEA